jgi:hypothetical protein
MITERFSVAAKAKTFGIYKSRDYNFSTFVQFYGDGGMF